jgi:hypothetical protein
MMDISNTGVQQIVTDPDLPGFQMKIPAGAQIIGWDGQPNTQMSVRRVPIDRIPVPLLNDLDLPPGAQIQKMYQESFTPFCISLHCGSVSVSPYDWCLPAGLRFLA